MTEVSTYRMYALRLYYLIVTVGLALMIWPLILSHPADVGHAPSVVRALLGAVCLLAALGLRYPLRMLPIMLFELVWKTIWLVAFALPASLRGPLEPAWQASVVDTGVGVVLSLLLIPWPYVYANYVRAPADRWRGGPGIGHVQPGVAGSS